MSTRFQVEQPIAAPVEDVQAAFLDAEFYPRLGALPGIAPPAVLARRDEGGLVHLRTRYRFAGDLSPAVKRVVDPERLTWIDESTIDVAARHTTFEINPEHYGDRLTCRGEYRLVEVDGRTLQQLSGEVTVRWPVVGRLVERGIIRGLEEHLQHEAAVIEQWAAER